MRRISCELALFLAESSMNHSRYLTSGTLKFVFLRKFGRRQPPADSTADPALYSVVLPM